MSRSKAPKLPADVRELQAYVHRLTGLLEQSLKYVAKGASTPTPYHEADYNAIELHSQIRKELENGRQPV